MQNNTLVMDSIFITTRRTKQDLTLPNSTTSRTRDSLTTTDSMSYENKTYYRYGEYLTYLMIVLRCFGQSMTLTDNSEVTAML